MPKLAIPQGLTDEHGLTGGKGSWKGQFEITFDKRNFFRYAVILITIIDQFSKINPGFFLRFQVSGL